MDVNLWRAEYLLLAAERLEIKIDKLKRQAEEFKNIANSLTKHETLYELNTAYADGDQSLRVEQWPEGHVVWANGKIIFKSWET